MRKMDKKGIEITLNFIVIAALVLITMIVAILFFTSAGEKLLGKEAEVTQAQLQREISLAEGLCRSHCSFESKEAFNNPGFSADLVNANYKSCSDLLGGSYESLCGTCTGGPECVTKNTQAECSSPCVWNAAK